MSPSWKNALSLAIKGIGLAVAASLANFLITQATVDGFMRDWVAQHGFGGSTELSLGIILTNMLVYPAIVGVVLVLVLPFVLGHRPEWAQRRLPATILIGLPTLLVAALWWAGPSLLLTYTLPASGLMAAAAALLVLAARGLGSAAP